MHVRQQPADSREIRNLLTKAIGAHKAGQLEEAKQFYLEVLAINVKHAKSLYGIGLIAHETGNLDAAARMMQRAIAVDPKEAEYRASLGAVLREQRKLDEALTEYNTALALRQDDEETHFNVAEIYREQGRLTEAEHHYKRALAISPDFSETHQNLGIVLRRLGRLEEAIACFERALALNPSNVAVLHNLGNVLLNGGNLEGAKACFERALALKPDLAEAHNGLGVVLLDQGALDAAETCYLKALKCKTDYAEAECNLGNLARRRGQLEDAKLRYERALALNPNLAEAHSNLGMIAQNQGKLGEARVHYDRALELEPGSADARWSGCLLDLLEGNFTQGWKEYEIRYTRRQSAPRSFPGPLWRGEPLDGARILLHAEQGLGDTLQFLRYAPLVLAAGGSVLLDVQAPVRRLAEELLGITVVAVSEGDLPSFEWQCPLMGLPLAFGTTLESIPRETPYLTVPQAVLGTAGKLDWPADGLRVGMIWSGNPEHKEDRYRSIALPLLEPLWSVGGVWFFSLQLGAAASQLGDLRVPVIDLQSAIKDFADTAALMTHLDLVITVDTAVAHLAGALARQTWVLLPFAPDWRWLTEREDSPWYPTMRLFRQTRILDWASVIERVRMELEAMAGGKRAN
jgi:tetratricopeptide (TPR) repeat protein